MDEWLNRRAAVPIAKWRPVLVRWHEMGHGFEEPHSVTFPARIGRAPRGSGRTGDGRRATRATSRRTCRRDRRYYELITSNALCGGCRPLRPRPAAVRADATRRRRPARRRV